MIMNYIINTLIQLKLTLNRILADKFLLLLALIIAIIFLILVYFLYIHLIKPLIYKDHVINKEFTSKKDTKENDVLIIIFKTEWCPYCKSSMGEWNKFVNYIKELNQTIDYTIRTSVIDCDKQEDIANKYNIEAYPSIILLYKNKTYEYDASADKDNLIAFLESSTKKDNKVIYSKD